jgi:uncharacterized membrane protein
MKRIAVVPSPALLAEYNNINPNLPLSIVEAGQRELAREFQYAIVFLVFGGCISLSIIGGFVYLAMQDHPTAAGALLGAGVLNMVTGFVRNRFRK